MDYNTIAQKFEIVVLLACLAVGYITKKWIKDVDNKYIPTIVLVLGAILNCMIKGFTVEAVVYGAIAGLASTGMHQAFVKFVEGKGTE